MYAVVFPYGFALALVVLAVAAVFARLLGARLLGGFAGPLAGLAFMVLVAVVLVFAGIAAMLDAFLALGAVLGARWLLWGSPL